LSALPAHQLASARPFWVIRTPGARVTVELKRSGDVSAIRAALVDALGQLDAAGQGRGEAA
jgi:hypothetical protein